MWQKIWDNPHDLLLHNNDEQLKRQIYACKPELTPILINMDDNTGYFKKHKTSLTSCTCHDYVIRNKPCKHMYRLAYELGLFKLPKDVKYFDMAILSDEDDDYKLLDKSTGEIISFHNKYELKWALGSIWPQKIKAQLPFNKNCPFRNKYFAFTGKLERVLRREAMQIVFDLGGDCTDNITLNTNYLVLGNLDYCKVLDGNKSNKVKKAEALIAVGQDLQIISEDDFYDLVWTKLN